MEAKKYFVTTPIYYPSDKLHPMAIDDAVPASAKLCRAQKKLANNGKRGPIHYKANRSSFIA